MTFEKDSNPTLRVAKHASHIDALCVLEKCKDTQKSLLHILKSSRGEPSLNSKIQMEIGQEEKRGFVRDNYEQEMKNQLIDTTLCAKADDAISIESKLVSKIVKELDYVASGLQPKSNPLWICVDMSGPSNNDFYRHECKSAMVKLADVPSVDQGNLLWPTVVLGGTFDRIHEGHSVLLTIATAHAQNRIVVGLSSGVLLAKKRFANYVQPYALRHFLLEEAINLCSMRPVEIVVDPLYDVYGIAGTMQDIHVR